GDLVEQRLGVLVPGPQPFEIEHAESAELTEHDRRLRADDGIHRRAEDRDVERKGVDRPGRGHVLGVAGSPRWDHRDVVERVRATRALASADLDVHAHPSSLPVAVPVAAVIEGSLTRRRGTAAVQPAATTSSWSRAPRTRRLSTWTTVNAGRHSAPNRCSRPPRTASS